MAARGQTTKIMLGGSSVGVKLIKTTAKPVEAKYETKRVEVAQAPMPEVPASAYPASATPLPEPELAPVDPFASVETEPDDVPTFPPTIPAETDTDEPEVLRGVHVGEKFVDLTEQLGQIDEACILEGMEVAHAIPRQGVPRERVTGSSWVVPDEPGSAKAIKLLALALKGADRALVVRWTKRTNQALGVLVPKSVTRGRTPALMLLELEWAECWREPSDRVLATMAAEVSVGEVAAAKRFVEAYDAPASRLDELHDERLRLRGELLDAARSGRLETFAGPPVDAEVHDADVEGLAEIVDLAAAR